MENIEKEIWKDIKGYEGFYQVSNLGNIKSLKSFLFTKSGIKKQRRERLMNQTIKYNGYKTIMFSINNNHKRFHVHRIVAQTFILNIENKPQVNHKNGIKADNRVENLEWVTASENSIHAIKNNLIKTGEDSSYSKLTKNQVLIIRRLFKINPNFNKTYVAKKLGVRDTTIHKIINNQRWKHLL